MGRRLSLRNILCPAYLLAGADDDITTPEQVLDAAKYIGTPNDGIVQKTVPAVTSAYSWVCGPCETIGRQLQSG